MQENAAVAIVIPSLNPDDKLLQLLADLRAAAYETIVLVNDGSSEEYDSYFETARTEYGCTVLTHAVNQGKGRALKTAFSHLLTTKPFCSVAVTVDADGQHRVPDIAAVAHETQEHPEALVMGCRDFSPATQGVPARSRFGNVLTSRLLKLLCGIALSDTQTGLRGFSPATMRTFLSTKGERYEFEMNMILDAKEYGIPLREVPIETIYIEENKTSHFNPLKDSLRIYSVFAKFIAASLSSFALDLVLYTVFCQLFATVLVPPLAVEQTVIVAAYAARIFSALFNYTVNRRRVFKSSTNASGSLLRYAVLSLAQVTVSAFSTAVLYGLTRGGKVIWKLVVDLLLFLVSFRFQRSWVFRK